MSVATRPDEHLIGAGLEQIDTPALLVDMERLERNIATMAAFFKDRPARLRPHAKTPRCPEVALMQIKAGAHGITCAKVSMAEALVDGGVDDVYVANQVVTPFKIDRLVRLASRARVGVAVDDAKNAADLSVAATGAGVVIDILIEVDAGMRRAGTQPGRQTLDLARAIVALPGLRFKGLHAYEGHCVQEPDPKTRTQATHAMLEATMESADLLRRSGIAVDTITCGGTGTYKISGVYPGVTEHQAGSYVYMDPGYHRLLPEFEISLSILATVVSRPLPNRVVTDAGIQVCAGDHGPPEAKDRPELGVPMFSEEHTTFTLEEGAVSDLGVGDRLELHPAHCDSANNLHDRVFAVRRGRVEAVWPVTARGKSQ